MGKQHRPPGRSRGADEDVQQGRVEAEEVGSNAEALSSQPATADLDLVRAVAAPLVERALLALALPARPSAQVDRFVHVVERSALPAERRDELVGKLRADQAADRAVRAAVARHLGDEAAREGATRLLDAVHEGLVLGGPSDAGWAWADRDVALSGAVRDDGPVGARADALVRELADALAPEGVGAAAPAGPSALALCRTLQHLVWEEEEEEDEVAGPVEA